MTNESIRLMAEFTEVLKNDPNHAYDFIAVNGWKMGKEELTQIVKELLYGIYHDVSQMEHDEILRDVGIELDEHYEDYYQEVIEEA